MDRCSEYRLSLGSTSTKYGETSIYDTYGRDWACMSARSTCPRSEYASEIGDPSELTWLLKERRLTHTSTTSDESTEPPNDLQADTGGSSTPVTSGEPSVPFDQSGFVSSRQAVVLANISSYPEIPANLTRTVKLEFSTTSSLAPRFDSSCPLVVHAKPVVQDAERTPHTCEELPQSYRICDRHPLLSFRSYDSVHCFEESSKGQISCQNSFIPSSARSAHCRSNSWAPSSSRLMRERESDGLNPCDLAEREFNGSSDSAAHRTNSSCRKLPAAHVLRTRCAPSVLRQNSCLSEIGLVDCHFSSSEGSSKRSSSVSSHDHGRRRIRSEIPCAPSTSKCHVQSSDVGVQCVIDGAQVGFGNSRPITQESKVRSQSAAASVETRHSSNQGQGRVFLSNVIPPSSPERHLRSLDLEINRDIGGVSIGFKDARTVIPPSSSERDLRSPDLEINRDIGGVSIGFQDTARYRSAPSLASLGSSPSRIVRSSSLAASESGWGISVGLKEDHFRSVARSQSWIPPSCESRLPARAQSWAPPLQIKTMEETLAPLLSSKDACLQKPHKREPSRDIVRPLCSSRVSSLERPPFQRDASRDIVRPLCSSRVSSLERPPFQRDASRDIVKRLASSHVSSLAAPPDRQVCSTHTEPCDIFQSWRLPSPPRRKVSRQLS